MGTNIGMLEFTGYEDVILVTGINFLFGCYWLSVFTSGKIALRSVILFIDDVKMISDQNPEWSVATKAK